MRLVNFRSLRASLLFENFRLGSCTLGGSRWWILNSLGIPMPISVSLWSMSVFIAFDNSGGFFPLSGAERFAQLVAVVKFHKDLDSYRLRSFYNFSDNQLLFPH